MIYHTKMCLDEGCEEEEVLEAVAVSAAFGGGAVMSQAVTLVLESLSEFGFFGSKTHTLIMFVLVRNAWGKLSGGK